MNFLKRSAKKLWISILITAAVMLLALSGAARRIENMARDALYRKPAVIPGDIKIIAIDEETLIRLGAYSDWDRSYFTRLIQLLNEHEDTAPKVIAIDVVFSGTNGGKEDRELAETVGKYQNIVLASGLDIGSRLVKGKDGRYTSVGYIAGESRPYDMLAEVSEYGFTNAVFDEDGVIRRNYTRIRGIYEGAEKTYNSFAYAAASKVTGLRDLYGKTECVLAGKPGEFEHLSMADVLDGAIPADYFADCIVLVGAYEEGLMDAYRVPNDYAKQMYGVELQANYIYAFLHNRFAKSVNAYLSAVLTAAVLILFSYGALGGRIRRSLLLAAVAAAGYVAFARVLFAASFYKLPVLTIPLGILFAFVAALLYRYVDMQRRRNREMRETLFSMAEAMAQAIEGRTPYNANHTKNVAKRCLEMLDYINRKHREKQTGLHFTEADKRQLYLAAMLHDVGKMDVPLKVMDKPTKLGERERELSDRLRMIMLRLELDDLKGRNVSGESVSGAEAEETRAQIAQIGAFLEKLGDFNCGRPLREEEWKMIDDMADRVYVGENGEETPYLTREEIEDLHIRAGTLSERERDVMQSHVVYTDKILSHIQFGESFADVRVMAANHHELLNGKGYPHGIEGDSLDVMTRILTIMDIYDSLIADDRPYKKPKTVSQAFAILDEEAAAGKIDQELLAFAKELYLKDVQGA